MFKYYVDKRPNSGVKIWKRELLVEGAVERKGKNWEDNSASSFKIRN